MSHVYRGEEAGVMKAALNSELIHDSSISFESAQTEVMMKALENNGEMNAHLLCSVYKIQATL